MVILLVADGPALQTGHFLRQPENERLTVHDDSIEIEDYGA
jgi:hypothetical protein